MKRFEALRVLARLAWDSEQDAMSVLHEAVRITASAIDSEDVRLFAGDGASFQAYPERDDEDYFGLSVEGSKARGAEARVAGGPVVYNVGPDQHPHDLAPADGTASGAFLTITLWRGEALAGSVVAKGPWAADEALYGAAFLEAASPALAVMLERVVDVGREQRLAAHMGALSSVARVFVDARNMKDAMQDVANAITGATGFLCSVDVLDADGEIAMRSAGADRYAETPLHKLWQDMTEAPDHVRALILEHKKPVLLPDLMHDPRISEEAREFYTAASIVSGATFPLLLHDGVVGLLRIGSLKPTSFPQATVDLLCELALQGAMVVNGVQLYEERERAQAALRESERRFRSLVQNASDLITVVEADTTITYQSPSIRRLLGLEAEELTTRKLSDLLHPDDLAGLMQYLGENLNSRRDAGSVEARLRHADGSWRSLEIIGADHRNDEAVKGFILNARDVTERKELEHQLRYQAFHDSLTKLSNRARFNDRLEHALQRSDRSELSCAVLFMDLDDFKSVNDGLGHSVGDQVLVEVAERLLSCLREGDTCSRFGGDEFAILIEDAEGIEDAAQVAGRISDALREPCVYGGKEFTISASVGIAMSDPSSTSADDLLRRADLAMYAAKNQGKAHFEVYEREMSFSVAERLELLAGLHRAVKRGEFVLHYQPIISLQTDRVEGIEALVRWDHPERGLMYPEEFIALAEENGAILGLGSWALPEACRRLKTWQDSMPATQPLSVNVNITMAQLQQRDFVCQVRDTLDSLGLDPATLVLEITENAMMQDVDLTVSTLSELKELGVRVAIDDFGTGYSSLTYLSRLPLDILKIDRSFIERANDEEQLLRAIIDLGKSLGLTIVAEGIETVEQLERLRSLGCDAAQGYLMTKPLPPVAFDAFLKEEPHWTAAA